MSRNRPPPQEPVRTKISSGPMETEGSFEETHPAYICLVVNRHDGMFGPLFGSLLPNHHGCVSFKVVRAERTHTYAQDHIHGDLKPILEWRMSYAQFVEIMSQMNRGSGVPATLVCRQRDDGTIEDFPEIKWPEDTDGTEAGAALKSVKAAGKKLTAQVAAVAARVGKLLDEGKVTKKLKDAVLTEVGALGRTVGDSIPFYLDQVQEAGEKVVSAARIEVDAVVTSAVSKLGFQALEDLKNARLPGASESKAIESKPSSNTFRGVCDFCGRSGMLLQEVPPNRSLAGLSCCVDQEACGAFEEDDK